MVRMRGWLLTLAVIAVGCTSSTASGPPPVATSAPAPVPELLSAKQIVQRMEASPVK